MNNLHLNYTISLVENLTDDPAKEDDAIELARDFCKSVEQYAEKAFQFQQVFVHLDLSVTGSDAHFVISNHGIAQPLVDFDPQICDDIEAFEVREIDRLAMLLV